MVIAFCDQKQYRDLLNTMVKKAAYDNTTDRLKPNVILLFLTALMTGFLMRVLTIRYSLT